MLISKDKNIVITFDNEVVVSNQEVESSKKAIIFNFVDADAGLKDTTDSGTLVITNPGEYEYSDILIKVSEDLNIFLSENNVRIYYAVNPDKVEDDKNASIADIFIFDSLLNKKVTANKIIELEKITQPKIIVVNVSCLEDSIENSEKVSKLKLKQSDLDVIIDTKTYLL